MDTRHEGPDTTTVYVKVLSALPDYLPTRAWRASDRIYILLGDAVWSEETAWEFQPGTAVRCEMLDVDGVSRRVAVSRAS